MKNLNYLKLLLFMDEKIIYKHFKSREDSTWAQSIKPMLKSLVKKKSKSIISDTTRKMNDWLNNSSDILPTKETLFILFFCVSIIYLKSENFICNVFGKTIPSKNVGLFIIILN
jgi:hypothetical protein